MADEKKIVIDKDKCIGCGSCVSIAEEYFKLGEDGKSGVIKEYDQKDSAIIQTAIDSCPADAISLE